MAKPGYEKIRFCGEKARRDGLQYFWIDNCCIEKENHAELSLAINSMFRWYRNSARCYVYLSDISSLPLDTNPECKPQKSRWFNRGWTLQELLGPRCVEFFSKEHKRLGNKTSLTQQIHERMGIPRRALEGVPLSQFSDKERFFFGYNAARRKLKKIKLTHCLVFSASKCLFFMEKGHPVHSNDLRRRYI